MSASSLTNTLQQLRKSRRVSQLELALRMGVSQRHVSFVESGRSQPSRELLLIWMHELQAPLALRNEVLLQAGFAPAYKGSGLTDSNLIPIRDALDRMLNSHDPMPALVIDANWNVLQVNRGAHWLFFALAPWLEPTLTSNPNQPINLLDVLLHPEGIVRHVTNLAEVAPALITMLNNDAIVAPDLQPRLEALIALFQQRLGTKAFAPPSAKGITEVPTQSPPLLTTRFATSHGELAFFSMFSTFGTPQDITLASLRVEHMFAADDHTRAVMNRVLS